MHILHLSSKISSLSRKSLKRYILKQFFYELVTTSEYISRSCDHSFRAQGFENILRESLMSHLQSCVRKFLVVL